MNYEQWMSGLVAAGDTVAGTVITKTQFTNARLELGVTSTTTTVNAASELQFGRAIDVDLHGIITTDAAAPGTLTVTIDWGNGTPTYTALGTTGAITLPLNLTNAYWCLRGRVIFNICGASGIATFSGHMIIQNAANVPLLYGMVATTTSGTSGWATSLATNGTAHNQVACSVLWGGSVAANSITLAGGSRMARVA